MSWKVEVSREGAATNEAAASKDEVLKQVTNALDDNASEISIKDESPVSTKPVLPPPDPLPEEYWETLVQRIKDHRCTPFLGAGVNAGILPLGGDIAKGWASKKKYPLPDIDDLARVAQYRALTDGDRMQCKEELSRLLRNIAQPPLKKDELEDQPLRLLAKLPVPVYVTTNYDDFMFQALADEGKKPRRELCKWNQHPNVTKWKSVWKKDPGFDPSDNQPVVFHLHGINDIYESLVLTEDDYLDFLATMSKQSKLLPARIQEALSGSSILFVDYSLADWTFRVLFRGLNNSIEPGLRRISVAVQLPPTSGNNPATVQKYLSAYFGNMDVKCYWGTAQQFMLDLKDRMARYD